MATSANSYGTAADVAALVDLYTTSGSFTSSTVPTIKQVDGWIDQVSALMNAALAANGFVIPLTQADAVLAAKSYVIQAAVDLAHAANSAGRFFTDTALQRGVNPMSAIRKEILDWVGSFADGLAGLGAARTSTTGAGEISFRDTDEGGDATHPIFQRDAFGNSFENWDT